MGQLKRGLALSGESWRVLRAHRQLVLFPLYGGISLLIVVLPIAAPGAWLVDRGTTVPGVALLAVGIYVAAFITTFFGVALAATAERVLRGKDASLRDGLALARTRLRAIAGWALLSATVSALIRVLESRGEVAQIVSGLLGAAWTVVTFLALPVVALEGLGPVAALKRSAQLFRARWGGQLAGMAAIGLGVGLLGMLPSIALVALGVYVLSGSGAAALGVALVAVGAAGFAISALIASTLRQVFAVALYRYALDGQALGGFSAADLESSVRTRSGGRFGRR